MSQSVYHRTDASRRREIEQFDPTQLRAEQLRRLNGLLEQILPTNQFYASKFQARELQLDSLEQLAGLPMTTKQDLVDSSLLGQQNADAGFAANLTFQPDQYARFHRTSGTRGKPMIVLDTNADWNWWMEVWQYVLDSAKMTKQDRVLMAFSFGPFIGFWSAFDAAVERGAMVIPTGAMSSVARLELTQSIGATVVFCTPSYALHLAELAKRSKIDLRQSRVDRIIVAGEPGGSIPSIRDKIESAWGARVIDHSGASEVGPWGFADDDRLGIHVNEAEFIPEFLRIDDPAADAILAPDQLDPSAMYELVLTCLGRVGSPVIRYRTGDLVRPVWLNQDGKGSEARFVLLKGGVMGRADDMMIIRGVNVFPTSLEEILRGFESVEEYRITAYKSGSMDQLKIEVEDHQQDAARIEEALQIRMGFRVEVVCVEIGSLPRFEAKGKRFIDKRHA